MSEIKITESIEVLATDPKRAGKFDRWITYTIDGQRTDMIIIAAESSTEANIKAEVIRKEAERAKTVGKTFQV